MGKEGCSPPKIFQNLSVDLSAVVYKGRFWGLGSLFLLPKAKVFLVRSYVLFGKEREVAEREVIMSGA
jgi:hypothetical protein